MSQKCSKNKRLCFWIIMVALVVLFAFVGCGRKGEMESPSPEVDDIAVIKRQIYDLIGIVSQINNFTASDYTDCSAILPAFERKVCQIAQTATYEQKIEFSQRLSEVSKIIQTKIYGDDCFPSLEDNSLPPGCPASGSVMGDLQAVQTLAAQHGTDIITIQSQISALQFSVNSLQMAVNGLQNRLNNFDGSGQTIESVISVINSTLSSLDSRLDNIESAINSATLYREIDICEDVTPTVGPIFDAVLMSGNNTKLTGYIQTGSRRGLGVVSEVGSGDKYMTTTVSNLSCKFAVYDLASSLKVCWVKNNRSASNSQIDTACGRTGGPSGGSVAPGPNCTCQ